MQRIELANVDSIINDDTSLQKLVTSFIGNESGEFIFILPEGTSENVRNEFNNFINKVTWEFERISRNTKIHPTQIKVPVFIPEPVVIPEPIPEVVEPEVTDTPKRKK
jgi:hypothetical protein